MEKTKLVKIIEPVVTGLECELWGIEYFPQGKYSILRVYIDNESGVTIDDCARVSQQLSAVLDVEEPIKNHYTLEVSSPGIDRPLFTLAQFARFTGYDVRLKMYTAVEGQRNFTGTLQGVVDQTIIMMTNGREYQFSISDVEKANLLGQL